MKLEFRDVTDFGAAVDALLKAASPPPADDTETKVKMQHVAFLLGADRLIDAIKTYRSLTGASLKDSKDFCERMREEHRAWQ